MDNDKKLTVLLPLKGNVPYTWRWMFYADKTRFPYHVLIADGGADKKVGEILSDKTRFPNVDYEYVRYPYDQTYPIYYAKMADALSHIDTPFVAMASNDDFFFVNGLRNAVDFLQAHPDYAASGGDIPDFSVQHRENDALSRVYGSIGVNGKIYSAMNLVDETALERFRSLLWGEFNSFLWPAVHRTENLRKAFQDLLMLDLYPNDLLFADNIIYFSIVAAGKTRRVSDLYLLHQDNPHESEGRESCRKYPTFLHKIERKGWVEDFLKMVDVMGKKIADHDRIPVNEACYDFKHVFLSYVGQGVVEQFYPQIRQFKLDPGKVVSLLQQSAEFKGISEYLNNIPVAVQNLRNIETEMTKAFKKTGQDFVAPNRDQQKSITINLNKQQHQLFLEGKKFLGKNDNIPLFLQVEIATACNAKCTFCPYRYGLWKKRWKKTIIEENIFYDAIDQYREMGGHYLSLTPMQGEALLDKDILKKIRYAKGFDLIYFYTNAILLDRFDLDELLESGLTHFFLSTTFPSREYFFKAFGVDKYNIPNISNLLKAFKNSKTSTVKKISLEFRSGVPLPEVYKQHDFKKFIQPYLSEKVGISNMNFFDPQGIITENDLLEGMVFSKDTVPYKVLPCSRIYNLYVGVEGNLRLCGCRYDPFSENDEFYVGNIRDMTIREAFNSDRAKFLIDSFLKLKNVNLCKKCPWYSPVNTGLPRMLDEKKA